MLVETRGIQFEQRFELDYSAKTRMQYPMLKEKKINMATSAIDLCATFFFNK